MAGDSDFRDYLRLAEKFDTSGDLADYLSLRREFPGVECSSERFSNTARDAVIEEELKSFGIERRMMDRALAGDDREMDKLVLRLMENLVARRKMEKAGQTHLQSRAIAIGNALIDYLAVAMLEACETEGLPLTPSLVLLIRERLVGGNPERLVDAQLKVKKRRAAWIGASVLSPDKNPSVRQIAAEMGLHPSTVLRWFDKGELEAERDRIRKWFVKPNVPKGDADG